MYCTFPTNISLLSLPLLLIYAKNKNTPGVYLIVCEMKLFENVIGRLMCKKSLHANFIKSDQSVMEKTNGTTFSFY